MAQEPLAPGVVEGVYAYAEKSVYAGETVSMRVSSSVPYRMTVVRLGSNTDGPSAADVPLAPYPFKDFPVKQQPITPGSYVNIDQQLPPQVALPALTLECWVRPWRVTGDWEGTTDQWQGLISQYTYDGACGFGLFLDENGLVNFYAGNGGKFRAAWMHLGTAAALTLLDWYHVVGVWDGSTNTASLWVNGAASGSWQTPGFQLTPGKAPLRLAAYGDKQGSQPAQTQYCFDGDLAMPAIYNYALTAAQIQTRYQQGISTTQAVQPPALNGVLGCWPMTEEKGNVLGDISSSQRNGKIINNATWMIGGPNFNGSLVPRYPSPPTSPPGPYNPTTDPIRGHGLRFASDDLFDCGWTITKTYTIPADAQPGIYSGRILYGNNFESVYDVSFVVKKPRGTKSDVLVLCATNTWFAYNQSPFQDPTEPSLASQRGAMAVPFTRGDDDDDDDSEDQNPPEYSFYLNHHAYDIAPNTTGWIGQPTYFVGLNMPCPAAQPYALFAAPPPEPAGTLNYSHLVRAERFLHLWLETQNYDFDLATDSDLDSEPNLLANYKVLIINGHSEYWSAPAYQNVQTFLNNKGQVAVLSGNTMFWRVSFDPSGTVMECRKVPYDSNAIGNPLGGRPWATTGEMWHSDDGQRGGLMREAGYPAYPLIGLECAGWFDPPPLSQDFGVYQCTNPTATLFTTPNATGLKTGDCFGYVPQSGASATCGSSQVSGVTGVVGHEYDIRISNPQMCTVQPYPNQPPTGATIPSEPPNIQTLAQATMPGDTQQANNTVFDYYVRWYDPPPASPPLLLGEMIYWLQPGGGQVFHAGAIGSGWALFSDTVMQNVMSNVLSLFNVEPSSSSSKKGTSTKVGDKAPAKGLWKKGGPKRSATAPAKSGNAASSKPSKPGKYR